ncbi:hypothetical protein [Kribbella sindirgiensis]|uniref:Uncharacterized protein n=1 Tax=Kribbella sindirgiensis TaxID=1124744 RepID=A0A4R0I407_9ACTN|nr:hypothetical protein [Kribbella sindirgiensis]TCC17962.1 hypothetical protein E0H50_39250 [Kribbella sindirgiensis]
MRRRTFLAASGLIVAASRSYPDVARDLGGDHRTGRAADVGADEYSVRRPTYRPLMPTDAGPHAR